MQASHLITQYEKVCTQALDLLSWMFLLWITLHYFGDSQGMQCWANPKSYRLFTSIGVAGEKEEGKVIYCVLLQCIWHLHSPSTGVTFHRLCMIVKRVWLWSNLFLWSLWRNSPFLSVCGTELSCGDFQFCFTDASCCSGSLSLVPLWATSPSHAVQKSLRWIILLIKQVHTEYIYIIPRNMFL